MSRTYRVRFYEEVYYETTVVVEEGETLLGAIEAIIQDGEFHPIEDFQSVAERELVRVEDEKGELVDPYFDEEEDDD